MNKELFINMHKQMEPGKRAQEELMRRIEQSQRTKRSSMFIGYGAVIAACLMVAVLAVKIQAPGNTSRITPGNPTPTQAAHNNTPSPAGNIAVIPTPAAGNIDANKPVPGADEGEQAGGIGGQTPLTDIYDMKFTSFAYPFWKFAGGDDEFMQWSENKLKELKEESCGDLTKNTDPTMLDFIKDFDIPKEDFAKAANEPSGGPELSYTAEEIDIIYSNDMKKINETFMNPAALLVDGKIYPVQWLMSNSYEKWRDAGIELAAVEEKEKELGQYFHGEILMDIMTRMNGYKDFLGRT